MTPLELLLAVLAAYRVAHMLAQEDGPFDLFARLRGRFDPAQSTWLGRGLNCVACLSFWVSLAAALLLQRGDLNGLIISWLAIAGGVLVIHRILG